MWNKSNFTCEKIQFQIWKNPISLLYLHVYFHFHHYLHIHLHFQSISPLGQCFLSRNVRLCVCPSVRLFVCVFTFEIPFERLFAPTSWSWMSNIFIDSESFEKSNGKKWSQIWTFLFENCLKSPLKKSFFFADFALQNLVETKLPDGLETSCQRVYR